MISFVNMQAERFYNFFLVAISFITENNLDKVFNATSLAVIHHGRNPFDIIAFDVPVPPRPAHQPQVSYQHALEYGGLDSHMREKGWSEEARPRLRDL